MVLGIAISLFCIGFLVWYVNKKISGLLSQKEWLTRFVALMLTSFLALFIVDKIVSFRTPLLSKEMSDNLFELIKNIVPFMLYIFIANVVKFGRNNTRTHYDF